MVEKNNIEVISNMIEKNNILEFKNGYLILSDDEIHIEDMVYYQDSESQEIARVIDINEEVLTLSVYESPDKMSEPLIARKSDWKKVINFIPKQEDSYKYINPNKFPLQKELDDLKYSHLTKAEREANIIPVRNSKINPKINRNEMCPCGSGKKYKKCCGSNI